MKYMLLIHQGTTPTPRSPQEWAKLSEEEQQAVYADDHATRGELLRRLGRNAEARDAYERALTLVHGGAERRLLERRLDELG